MKSKLLSKKKNQKPAFTFDKRAGKPALSAAALLVASAFAMPAFAGDVNWLGTTSTEWFTTTNWDTGALPTASDNVHIDNGASPYAALIDEFNTATANTIYVGDAATGVLGITGTTVTLTTTSMVLGNAATGNGTFVTDVASIWNNSGDVYVGKAGTGTLQIADESVVTIGGTLYIANDAGSTGNVIIGAALGDTALEEGSLTAGAVVFGAGTGTLTFNHTSAGYEFDTPISGNGTIYIAGGVTLFGGDDSGFTGTTSIVGGELYLNDNTLGGTVNVGDTVDVDGTPTTYTGTLTGYGTLTGAVNVSSGSVLSPTAGYTLTVDNDVTFASGAIYQAQVGASSAGSLHATGTVGVTGATLMVVGSGNADDYAYTSTYNIITADGGVSGTFASVTNNNLSFLDAVLAYDANDVTITLTRNGTWLVAAAQTPNQQRVASAVETLGVGNTVYDALITASGPDARTAYDSLSGEIHASARSVMIDGTRVVRDTLMERMSDAAAEDAVVDDSVIWMKGYGDRGNIASSSGAGSTGVYHSGGGALLGIDHPLGADGARIGAAAGYGYTSFGASARASTANDNSYRAALYGGLPFRGWNIRLGSDYAIHQLDTSRTATLPGINDHLSANYNAHTWQTFGEAGYPLELGEETTLEPYLGVSHIAVTTDDVTEHGGVTALGVQGSGYATNYASLGLHLTTPWYLYDTPIETHTTMAWQHGVFAKSAPTVTAFFESDPSASFTTTGALGKLNTLKLEFGGDIKFSERSLLRLDGLLQLGGMHDYGVQALYVFKL